MQNCGVPSTELKPGTRESDYWSFANIKFTYPINAAHSFMEYYVIYVQFN